MAKVTEKQVRLASARHERAKLGEKIAKLQEQKRASKPRSAAYFKLDADIKALQMQMTGHKVRKG